MRSLALPAVCLLTAALTSACSKDELATRTVTAGTELPGQVEETLVDAGPARTIIRLSDALMELVGSELSSGRLETRSDDLNTVFSDLGIKSVERLFPDAGEFEPRTRKAGLHKWFIIEHSGTEVPTRALTDLGSIPGVELVEEERPLKPCGFNDPYLRELWNYSNGSIKGFDVNVETVWNHYTTGRPDVVVAIVDGGLDLTHPDLAPNCHSEHYNFVDSNTTIHPEDHGTHVGGIIGAVNNNGIGVCGLAGGDAAAGKAGVRLMSCQIFKTVTNAEGKKVSLSASTARAIKWAADHGAVIAQNSWGYSYDSDNDGALKGKELETALNGTISFFDKVAVDYFIEYAGCDNDGDQLPGSPMKGGVVVFSAGNDGITNGVPANYDPVIAVGAVTKSGQRASYSNYGGFVDIAAPGSSIYSTVSNGKYGTKSGTSMACPHVSGVAALALSHFGGPGFTNEKLEEMLIGGANRTILSSSFQIGGLLDALGTMELGGGQAPSPVGDLRVEAVSNTLKAVWTVPKSPLGVPAYGFRVVCGTDREEVENADLQTKSSLRLRIVDLADDYKAGANVSCQFRDLDFRTDYFVKVLAYSYYKLYSPSAVVVKAQTKGNNPPVVSIDWSGPLVLKSHESLWIPVSASDPDGDPLVFTYTKGSNADSFSSVSGEEGIALDALKAVPGTYTLALTVKDPMGARASAVLTYTILENNPPVVVKEVGDKLLRLDRPPLSFTLPLDEHFDDPDGETLTYGVELTDKSMATAVIKDGRLDLGLTARGSVGVSVKASDARGTTAVLSFRILARADGEDCLLYPNPVKDVLNIATGLELETAQVRIVSSTGATVFDALMEVSGFEPGQVDLSGCAPGRYSVNVKAGSVQSRQTIVKK